MVFNRNDSEIENKLLEGYNFANESVVIEDVCAIFFNAGEPKSGKETLKILNDCIDAYENNFERRMSTKPFTDIFEILSELKKEKKDTLRLPFLDMLKSIDYDKICAVMRLCGAQIPPKSCIKKLKAGGDFNFRFKKLITGIDFLKFNMDDFYNCFDALKDAKDGDFEAYFDSMFLVSTYMLMLKVCTSLYQYDDMKKEILEKNVANFVLVAVKLCIVKQYKSSKDRESILQALLVLTNFMCFDVAQLEQLVYSDKIIKKIQSANASRERKKAWKHLDEYYDRAVKLAMERWEAKDQRLHHQMANDLMTEINSPIVEKIRIEVLKEYSRKDPNQQNEDAYKDEIKKRIAYETMSVRTLKKKLQPIAVKYKRFYDPGSRARKN